MRCCILASLLTFGCASSSSDGNSTANNYGHFSSGVPAATRFDALSDSQRQQLCDAILSFYTPATWQATLADTCPWAAVISPRLQMPVPTTDAQAQTLCREYYNQCVSSPPPMTKGDDCSDIPSCPATIADLELCFNDRTAYAQAAAAAPSCDVITLADVTNTPTPTLSAACTTLQTQCPGFFGSSAQ